MDFDRLTSDAWQHHADQPDAVAATLDGEAASLVTEPAQIPRLAHLLTHLWGEHLGRWAEGRERLADLRRLPAWDGSRSLADAVQRGIAVLDLGADKPDALDGLDDDNRVAALAGAGAALAGRGETDRALASFSQALASVQGNTWPEASPVWRALAVAGNNLAATLEEQAVRTPAQTAGMVRAAETAVTAWQRAGGWLEHERAEYRLARSLLQAQRAADAQAAARRCIGICEAHAAPPFERFFGEVVLALACRLAGDTQGMAQARAAALAWLAQMPADDQTACAAERAELG